MSDRLWEPAAYTTAAVAEIARMADAIRGVDPDTRVPTCPDWSVAELVTHTGTVHRWATQMVRDRATKRLDPGTLELGLPDDALGYADWLAAGAEPLASVFGAADPDVPMWAWGADQHARFWLRRMVHETAVHRADVDIAAGRQPRIDAAIAADAIDELLDNLRTAGYFRPRVEELRGDGETLVLRAHDTGDAWSISLATDGYQWQRVAADAVVAGSVSVTARAEALTLLLYARADPVDDGYDVVGDQKVLARWLECSAL